MDEDIDICDDIFGADYANDLILQRLKDYEVWTDAFRFLEDIPECDFYRQDGYGDLEDAEGYFDEYKEDVLQAMDNGDYWDEEEEDAYLVEEDVEFELEFAENGEEDISSEALFEVLRKAG